MNPVKRGSVGAGKEKLGEVYKESRSQSGLCSGAEHK